MRQLDVIREHLLNSVNELASHPDKLQIWGDKGKIHFSLQPDDFNHHYDYVVNVLVTDFSQPVASISIPLMAYIKNNASDSERVDIDVTADIIDRDRSDILFSFSLSDKVLTKNNNGNVSVLPSCEPSSVLWFREQMS